MIPVAPLLSRGELGTLRGHFAPAPLFGAATMPDASGHLYLFEALLLREDYDRRLKVLERLVTPEQRGRGLLGLGNDDTAEPAPGFEPEQAEEELKGLKARRLKLNRAVQACNVQSTLSFEGEAVTLAEALELRKSLLAEASRLADRVVEAAL